jgi:hypothetical protein
MIFFLQDLVFDFPFTVPPITRTLGAGLIDNLCSWFEKKKSNREINILMNDRTYNKYCVKGNLEKKITENNIEIKIDL